MGFELRSNEPTHAIRPHEWGTCNHPFGTGRWQPIIGVEAGVCLEPFFL
jgi:hypothetical protein